MQQPAKEKTKQHFFFLVIIILTIIESVWCTPVALVLIGTRRSLCFYRHSLECGLLAALIRKSSFASSLLC
jgi:hypothetical protein